MKILVITEFIPMPDRQAGMLRLSHFLRFLAQRHQILLYAGDAEFQCQHFGEREVKVYEDNLSRIGVRVCRGFAGELLRVLRRERFDVVLFEHYLLASKHLVLARCWQPAARIVIDTVDVVFQRLLSKAQITGAREDFAEARKIKHEELGVYGKADVIIAISHADKAILHRENERLDVEVIPLINHVPQLAEKRITNGCALIFVGNFEHSANSDAIMYFCREVMPLVKRAIPDVRLRIIGNSPTAAIEDLADAEVEVLGYVPDIAPFYLSSDICIAPLTWGGGLKGKIAESMAQGLPVVTTSVGIEGFGLTHGENVLVGDTPATFAEAVIGLHASDGLYQAIRSNAWNYVNDNYSEQAAEGKVLSFFDRLARTSVKTMPLTQTLPMKAVVFRQEAKVFMERHVLWRFKQH